MSDWNRQVIEEFRANAGRVGGRFEGADLLILTSTGARTGRPHTTPLGCMPDGDRLLVFASNAGLPHDPAWYHNIRADPRVTVELGTETFDGVAVPIEGDERDRLYALRSEAIPVFAEYQLQTARVIPVVAVHRGLPDGAGTELARIHNDLRARLADLRADADALDDGRRDVPGLARQLREHCVSVCGVLGEHHDNEEGRAFPRLEAQFPGLAPVIARLRREHTAVTANRRKIQALLDDAGSRDPDRVRAELDTMTADLDAHFAYEEEQLGAVLDVVVPLWRSGRQRG
ncbi:nitroreductase/quinone reductase family protein [Actinomadura latina]|uniref:Nitroreductase family deazaflavin-dependent oxidoreductase n=1 Tax=Actinomadura latina TaxID=163603 RepID=A0A846Z7S3_9ACTN|nr:nitroreductase/quinone reductase family protein [Actinomadura latina]NKZ06156.1 nitroreductase family deazaflavin-dependent oxidoreductase [Actinomadura latina]